jgi:hypothetical protein
MKIEFSARNAKRLRDVLTYIFIGVIIVALLSFGAVQRIPFLVVACALFSVAIVSAALIGEPVRARTVFRAALALLIVMSGWILLQTISFSGNPLAHQAWEAANLVTGKHGGSISVSPQDSRASLLAFVVPMVTFMTGLILCTSDERSETILRTLIVTSAVIATLGLLQFILTPKQLLLSEKVYYLDSLTTVFVNRNTAATYLGLTTLGMMVICWQHRRQGYFRALKSWLSHGSKSRSKGKILWPSVALLLLVLTIMALLLTKSRAGITSTFVAILVLMPFLMLNRGEDKPLSSFAPRKRSKLVTLLKIVVGTLLVVTFYSTFAGRMLLRAETRGPDNRFCIIPGILNAINDNLWTGTGFGSFADVFPAYRNPECWMPDFWERAHNSYLEALLGLGVIFAVALILATLVLSWALIKGLRDRRRLRLYPALGISATLLVALHAILDFSLQIPGFALFFTAFMAPIISISLGRRRENVKPYIRSGSFHPAAVLVRER